MEKNYKILGTRLTTWKKVNYAIIVYYDGDGITYSTFKADKMGIRKYTEGGDEYFDTITHAGDMALHSIRAFDKDNK